MWSTAGSRRRDRGVHNVAGRRPVNGAWFRSWLIILTLVVFGPLSMASSTPPPTPSSSYENIPIIKINRAPPLPFVPSSQPTHTTWLTAPFQSYIFSESDVMVSKHRRLLLTVSPTSQPTRQPSQQPTRKAIIMAVLLYFFSSFSRKVARINFSCALYAHESLLANRTTFFAAYYAAHMPTSDAANVPANQSTHNST